MKYWRFTVFFIFVIFTSIPSFLSHHNGTVVFLRLRDALYGIIQVDKILLSNKGACILLFTCGPLGKWLNNIINFTYDHLPRLTPVVLHKPCNFLSFELKVGNDCITIRKISQSYQYILLHSTKSCFYICKSIIYNNDWVFR